MNLVIDIGNTRTKTAVFDNDKKILSCHATTDLEDSVRMLLKQYPDIDKAIFSNVRQSSAELNFLAEELECIEFTNETKLPVKNSYLTPETLGKDRLAAAVGASVLFPNQNSLIIDAGTCITIDFLDEENCFQGGAILLGICKKAEGLHTFTGKLPLISLNMEEKTVVTGKTTIESIASGVLNGTLFEVAGFIEYYKNLYKNLNIIISGGDADYFAKNLNFEKFVSPNLVLIGLNKILNFNAKN